MKYRTYLLPVLGALALLSSHTAQAASGMRGFGYLTEVYVGGWNQDTLMVRMNYSDGVNPPNSFKAQQLLRFDPELSEQRQRTLYAAALLALANGHKVQIYSHNTHAIDGQQDCTRATQLRVLSPR